MDSTHTNLDGIPYYTAKLCDIALYSSYYIDLTQQTCNACYYIEYCKQW
jgi:hypothetical protein